MSPWWKVFAPSSLRTFFGKSRFACFYKRGSSVTLRLGFLTESKSEDSKIAAERAVAHICGYGGNGRLGGFRFLCREACGFESHYPYQNEHHPCFEIFYRNTDGFLFGKPRGTRLSAFLCIAYVYRETSKLRRCFYMPALLYEHGFWYNYFNMPP